MNIQRSINEGHPIETQEEVDDRDLDFRRITPEDWIDLRGTLESKDNRRRISRESQNPNVNNKKA